MQIYIKISILLLYDILVLFNTFYVQAEM